MCMQIHNSRKGKRHEDRRGRQKRNKVHSSRNAHHERAHARCFSRRRQVVARGAVVEPARRVRYGRELLRYVPDDTKSDLVRRSRQGKVNGDGVAARTTSRARRDSRARRVFQQHN